MKLSSIFIMLFIFFLLPLFFHVSHSTTILVDGFSQWKNPNVHVGDSIIFKHKYNYNLYIFKNERAFNLCNFTQAILLNKPNSTSFTWHPSRLGYFYFTFNNGSSKTCQDSQKFAVKVSKPLPVASPEPTPGDTMPSAPTYPWPFHPHEEVSPSPSPMSSSPVTVPSLLPDKGGGMPFINSNPAVPLPTGEVDSTTIGGPLPTSGHEKRVGLGSLFQVQMAQFFVVVTLMVV